MEAQEVITINIEPTELYQIVSLYMIQINSCEEICKEELEDYGETELYHVCKNSLAFYRNELERVKPLFKQHDRIHYDMFEKTGWVYDEEVLY